MTTVLLGATGFVGSTLREQAAYDVCIHRANLASLRGQTVERIVCAALPATKWLANKQPQADADNMRRLCQVLRSVQAKQFILISTVDVYAEPQNVDEDSACDAASNQAYGAHRLQFEQFVRQQFAGALIVRLPALFGAGLKKNILYDLLHHHRLEKIQPQSVFQWYPLSRLTDDVQRAEAAGLRLVNVCGAPIATQELLARYFDGVAVGHDAGLPARYDVRSKHAALWGQTGAYALSKQQSLAALAAYVKEAL